MADVTAIMEELAEKSNMFFSMDDPLSILYTAENGNHYPLFPVDGDPKAVAETINKITQNSQESTILLTCTLTTEIIITRLCSGMTAEEAANWAGIPLKIWKRMESADSSVGFEAFTQAIYAIVPELRSSSKGNKKPN